MNIDTRKAVSGSQLKSVAGLLVMLLLVGCNNEQAGVATATSPQKVTQEAAIDWEYQIAYQRGIEAMNWANPAVSMISLRDGNFSLGGDYNTVYWISEPPTALAEAITPNNQTPYATVHLNTKNGPMVLEIPPASERTAIFGSAINVWQVPIADMGPAGMDQGKGGKYLFLPPGYDGEVPEGYLKVTSHLYEIYVALRLIPLGDASYGEAAEYAKHIKAYPLSQANNPPEGDYLDFAGKRIPTLPVYDLSFFEKISELLNAEPLLERDKVMGGMLASLGIEKGKPFAPAGKVKQALEKATKDGFAYLEYTFETPGYSYETYWPDRQWMGLRQPSKEGFVFDEGEYLLLDERGSMFHWLTFIPRHLGKASAYLLGIRDADGELLSGEQSYKLSVPANVPARDFWSVIAYGKTTKSFIYNDADKVGLSSYDKSSLKMNDDGTIDIYFGENAPAGLESNWIPTAGEDFFLLFRLYGPEEAYFDKSFMLPDVDRIN
jgi:hypothetical protein